MALILSAASGNFNAGATWVGGIVPGAADEARASTGHTVTITANVTCTELSNAGTGIFTLNDGVTLTANVTNKSSTGGRHCLQFTAASPAVGFIVGNVTGSALSNGSFGAQNTSSGTLTLTGNATGGPGTGSGSINNASTGTLTITGSVTGGQVSGNSFGAQNASTGTLTITGTVTGGTATGSFAVNNTSTGPVTIIGNVTAGAVSGVSNASTGTLTITGDCTASTSANAVNSTSATPRVSGSFISASNGRLAVNASAIILLSTPTLAKTRYALNGSTTYVDMFTADNSLGQAAITDVRFGTVYASGALTGVAYIPAASSVAFGVPVDNTTGTATLTAADVRAAIGLASANLDTQLAAIPTAVTNANAVWDELMSSHTTAGTYGGRIVRSTNSNNELQLNAQNHAAANVHQFQAAAIQSEAFATSAVTLFTGAMRTELTPELTEITEVHAIHGLDIANALTVTPTQRSSGAITQAITGDGTTNTVVTRV